MATKKAAADTDLFTERAASDTATRVWEFPSKFDWSNARHGDLVHFDQIRNWNAPGSDAEYMEAVGRIRSKGKTDDSGQRFFEVEIIYDDGIPRLAPDLRTFLLAS